MLNLFQILRAELIFFFQGSANMFDTTKIYRGFRVFESAKFSFENDPVTPEYMVTRNGLKEITDTKGYAINILTLCSQYIIARVKFNNTTRIHVIQTDYSGNTSNWQKYTDITDIYNTAVSGRDLFGVLWHKSSGNLLFATRKGGDYIYLSVYRANGSVLYDYLVLDYDNDGTPGSNHLYKAAGGTRYILDAGYYDGTAAMTINKNNELHVFWDVHGKLKNSDGETANWGRSQHLIAFRNVNIDSLFTNGSYRISNNIPRSYYESTYYFSLPNSFCNTPGGMTYTYDELLDRYVGVKC